MGRPLCWCCDGTLSCLAAQQRVGKLFRAERLQIFDLLADPDEVHGDRSLPRNRRENAEVFQAILGGHGGIGAVTEATYRLVGEFAARAPKGPGSAR